MDTLSCNMQKKFFFPSTDPDAFNSANRMREFTIALDVQLPLGIGLIQGIGLRYESAVRNVLKTFYYFIRHVTKMKQLLSI